MAPRAEALKGCRVADSAPGTEGGASWFFNGFHFALVVTDTQGFKAIKYRELPLYMLRALKELKSENDAVKTENPTLKQQLRVQVHIHHLAGPQRFGVKPLLKISVVAR